MKQLILIGFLSFAAWGTIVCAQLENEPFESFFDRFCASAQKDPHAGFHIDRIRFPLRVLSSDTERLTPVVHIIRDRSDFTDRKRTSPVPLCVGDGGFEGARIQVAGSKAEVHLTYGAGPQSTLHFQRLDGQWFLVLVDVFDS